MLTMTRTGLVQIKGAQFTLKSAYGCEGKLVPVK